MNATIAVAATLLACAAPQVPLAAAETSRSGPWSVELVDDRGRVLPTFQHRGRVHVLGALGERYFVRVRNESGRRAEVVVSVDGRDVIDGRPAGFGKRGYVIEPWGQLTIDGYRLSDESVAAFRFASVRNSYAARTGSARDVGAIGVAVFAELERSVPIPVPYEAPSSVAPQRSEKSASAAPGATRDEARAERRGLGTEFGEEHRSEVRRVQFTRASTRPESVLVLRYDDRAGLLALGIDVDGRGGESVDAWTRASANPFRESSFAAPPPGWRPRRDPKE